MSIHVGIFGPGLCGKSHAGKSLARSFAAAGRRSVVIYPPGHLSDRDWGAHAMVFTDRSRFLDTVWKSRGLAVFIDEATETVGRDAELTGLFTRSRHNGHVVVAMGHRATVLLPVQRDQFGTLFLFRASPGEAKTWAEEWAEPRLVEATTLPKYHFLLARKFAAPDGQHLVTRGSFPA